MKATEIDASQRVGDIAARVPGAAEVFERFGVDYCCSGDRALGVACACLGLSVDEVRAALAALPPDAPQGYVDWSARSPKALVDHLLATHHAYTRDTLLRCGQLMEKVRNVHGASHPELETVARALRALAADLVAHMAREERVLFPYVVALDDARGAKVAPPPSPFGTVRNPVRVMNADHRETARLLDSLSALTGGYAAPASACASWRTLYDSLAELARDLHQHIHLESNVLFPAAVALETSLSARAPG